MLRTLPSHTHTHTQTHMRDWGLYELIKKPFDEHYRKVTVLQTKGKVCAKSVDKQQNVRLFYYYCARACRNAVKYLGLSQACCMIDVSAAENVHK